MIARSDILQNTEDFHIEIVDAAAGENSLSNAVHPALMSQKEFRMVTVAKSAHEQEEPAIPP